MSFKVLALTTVVLTTLTALGADFKLGTPLKKHVSNQLIVAFSTPALIEGTRYAQLPSGEKAGLNTYFELETLFSYKATNQKSLSPYFTLTLLKAKSQVDAEELAAELLENPDVLWVEPNYLIEGDPREITAPNDPLYKDQKHHRIMHNPEAWEINQGSSDVIVAVTDDGIDMTHPDLASGIWVNPNEIPSNGIDDDENGYIDDINGWDFSNNSADLTPSGGHGTHLAGIINAKIDNGLGVVGTAPEVTVMPIKFTGGEIPWSSASVAKSYNYAIKNRAKIINTSYNVDLFASILAYTSSVDYAYKSGLLIFNSAGNARQDNPPRLKVPNVIFVSATNTRGTVDRKNRFSNYGYGIDLSAPGGDIYSTYTGGAYSNLSGTSMAAPNAAAVAALIWSEFPEYNNDQVLARLVASCDNIEKQNYSKYRNKLGAGRVNSYRALTEEVSAPILKEIDGVKANSRFRSPKKLTLILKNTLLPDPINQNEAFELIEVETGNQIHFTSKDLHYITNNKIDFYLPKLKAGKYLFRAKAAYLIDPFGQELDGNKDGTSGDDYEIPFEICTFCF